MFKQCSSCQYSWLSRETFLADPHIEIIGYQVSFDGDNNGLFLFNHLCKTTLALSVETFDDLYQGTRYATAATGTEQCSGYCLDMTDLRDCSAECKYAYVRDIIQIIRNWSKSKEGKQPPEGQILSTADPEP